MCNVKDGRLALKHLKCRYVDSAPEPITDMTFNKYESNADLLLTAFSDHEFSLSRLCSKQYIYEAEFGISCVDWLAPDRFLCGLDADISFWAITPRGPCEIAFITGHEKDVVSVSSPKDDHSVFGSAIRDGEVKVWDIRCSKKDVYSLWVESGESVDYTDDQLVTSSFWQLNYLSGKKKGKKKLSSTAKVPRVTYSKINSILYLENNLIYTAGPNGVFEWDLRKIGMKYPRPTRILKAKKKVDGSFSHLVVDKFHSSMFASSGNGWVYEFCLQSASCYPINVYRNLDCTPYTEPKIDYDSQNDLLYSGTKSNRVLVHKRGVSDPVAYLCRGDIENHNSRFENSFVSLNAAQPNYVATGSSGKFGMVTLWCDSFDSCVDMAHKKSEVENQNVIRAFDDSESESENEGSDDSSDDELESSSGESSDEENYFTSPATNVALQAPTTGAGRNSFLEETMRYNNLTYHEFTELAKSAASNSYIEFSSSGHPTRTTLKMPSLHKNYTDYEKMTVTREQVCRALQDLPNFVEASSISEDNEIDGVVSECAIVPNFQHFRSGISDSLASLKRTSREAAFVNFNVSKRKRNSSNGSTD